MPPRITRIASIIVSKKDARNTWKQKKKAPLIEEAELSFHTSCLANYTRQVKFYGKHIDFRQESL